MIPLIRCGFGIGNRIATIANALSREIVIQYSWPVNSVLPLTHLEVFPNGVAGVDFVTAPGGFATRWTPLVPGHSWEGARDRDRANSAYNRLMDSLAGSAAITPPAVAIIARFHRFPESDHSGIARAAARQAMMGDGRVFVLADSRREEISDTLAKAGAIPVVPASPEMATDLDRAPANLAAYFSDWKTASAARFVVTQQADSATIYPAQAAGSEIIRV